jgi:hypothetical protein
VPILVPIRETTYCCKYDAGYKRLVVATRRRYLAEFLATFFERKAQLKPRRDALIKEDFTPNTFLNGVTLIMQNVFFFFWGGGKQLNSDKYKKTGLIIAVQIIEVAPHNEN